MKTILFAAFMSLCVGGASAFARPISAHYLADNTPAAVKAAFAKAYPTVKKVTFTKEKGGYEAEFVQNGKSMSVVIDARGAINETETEIAVSALPAPVRDYVAKHMAGKKIKEAAELVDAEGAKTYEVEIGGKDHLFSADGKPLN